VNTRIEFGKLEEMKSEKRKLTMILGIEARVFGEWPRRLGEIVIIGLKINAEKGVS
jgi:hypothetical protein